MEAEVEGVHEYPLIHSIHTHIIKYGSIDEQRRLVLVIPGNASFYLDYIIQCACVYYNRGCIYGFFKKNVPKPFIASFNISVRI